MACVKGNKLWTNCTFFYDIDTSDFPAGSESYNVIEQGLCFWSQATSLQFIQAGDATNRVVFRRLPEDPEIIGTSRVGMVGDVQYIEFDADPCDGDQGLVAHEVGHALGLYHEQSRKDSPDYVTLYPENILPGMEHNFKIEQEALLNTPYDYSSIMHYKRDAFSKNGSDTIVPIVDVRIGQLERLSHWDILGIEMAYYMDVDQTLVGGGGGISFNDIAQADTGQKLSWVEIYYHDRVDGLRYGWIDGTVQHRGNTNDSDSDLKKARLNIADGDYLTKVAVQPVYRKSIRVGYLEFETANGDKIIGGSFGRAGVVYLTPPAETLAITGFHGGEGDEIDALGVIFGEKLDA